MIRFRKTDESQTVSDYSSEQQSKRFNAIRQEAERTGALGPALARSGVREEEYAEWLTRFAAASYDPMGDLDKGDKT